ncbi:hypothetical protein SESBI_23151 [Sesbania bispinosa]|nr:hypothetical protein SESBI_23151 [Sesbania bispinosa]
MGKLLRELQKKTNTGLSKLLNRPATGNYQLPKTNTRGHMKNISDRPTTGPPY